MPVEGDQGEVDGRDAFEWMLEGLTELERQVVTLRWWFGRSPDQIAVQLDKTRNAIDQRLHSAHRKIRARLNE